MSNRILSSSCLIALLLALPTSFAQAAGPTLGDVIAAQGNIALQQIRSEAAQQLPGRLRGQIALPPRAGFHDADDAGFARGAGHLYVEVDIARIAAAS